MPIHTFVQRSQPTKMTKVRKRQPTAPRKWFRFSDSERRRSVPPKMGRSVVDLIETHGHAA
jgi:hypothetical protein